MVYTITNSLSFKVLKDMSVNRMQLAIDHQNVSIYTSNYFFPAIDC